MTELSWLLSMLLSMLSLGHTTDPCDDSYESWDTWHTCWASFHILSSLLSKLLMLRAIVSLTI